MKLSPDRSDVVSAALREVCNRAADATRADNTDDARKRLNLVYWALHEATSQLNEAERLTRAEALQSVERAA